MIGVRRAAYKALSGIGKNGPDLVSCARLFRVWPQIVGENLAQHLWPLLVEGTTLTIGSSSGIWMNEARYMEEELIGRIADHAPSANIRELRFRLAPKSNSPFSRSEASQDDSEAARSKAQSVKLSAEDEQQIEEVLRKLDDGALRDQLRRVFRKARLAELRRQEG